MRLKDMTLVMRIGFTHLLLISAIISCSSSDSVEAAGRVKVDSSNSDKFHYVSSLDKIGLQGACYNETDFIVTAGAVRNGTFRPASKLLKKAKRKRSNLRSLGRSTARVRKRISSLKTLVKDCRAYAWSKRGRFFSGPVDRSLPELVTWENNMLSFGREHCQNLKSGYGDFDSRLTSVYYDAAWVFYQIADYSGDSYWNDCAHTANRVYRDQFAIASGGQVPGYWIFPHGILNNLLRTGDGNSERALKEMGQNAAFCCSGYSFIFNAELRAQ